MKQFFVCLIGLVIVTSITSCKKCYECNLQNRCYHCAGGPNGVTYCERDIPGGYDQMMQFVESSNNAGLPCTAVDSSKSQEVCDAPGKAKDEVAVLEGDDYTCTEK